MTVIGGAVRWSQSSTKPTFQTRGMSRDAILYFINIIYYFSQTSQLRFSVFLSSMEIICLPTGFIILLPYTVSLLVNVSGTVVLAKGLKPETEIRD